MNQNGTRIWIGEPFVRKDMNGKLVILQEEHLSHDGLEISIIEQLVDPDPSPAEIFKIRLKNPWDSDKPNLLRMPKNEQE
jgi:hypothetical protein